QYLIRGLGDSNASFPEEVRRRKYFETAKCLLATTEASKMAYHQILRGQTSLNFADYGHQKVCGSLTLNQVGEAYLRFHRERVFEAHTRTALFKSSPNIEEYLPEGLIEILRSHNIYENGEFLDAHI